MLEADATTVSKTSGSAFTCYSETAREVFLAGTFNDWSPSATPMHSNGHGQWTVSLPLEPGRHQYKFVVDGEWCCEPGCTSQDVHCAKCIINEFGTMNRVLTV